jgi:hypothetical protein
LVRRNKPLKEKHLMKKPSTLPQRREQGLLFEEMPTETLVYDTSNHKVHCLNPMATLVWRHCNGRTSTVKMAEILRQELDVPADEALVQLTLERLAETGLLREPWPVTAGITRRQASKQLAKYGIAAAAALVATIAAPSAAQAQSRGIGAPCVNSSDCASGCCCNGGGVGINNTCQLNPAACGNHPCHVP